MEDCILPDIVLGQIGYHIGDRQTWINFAQCCHFTAQVVRKFTTMKKTEFSMKVSTPNDIYWVLPNGVRHGPSIDPTGRRPDQYYKDGHLVHYMICVGHDDSFPIIHYTSTIEDGESVFVETDYYRDGEIRMSKSYNNADRVEYYRNGNLTGVYQYYLEPESQELEMKDDGVIRPKKRVKLRRREKILICPNCHGICEYIQGDTWYFKDCDQMEYIEASIPDEEYMDDFRARLTGLGDW